MPLGGMGKDTYWLRLVQMVGNAFAYCEEHPHSQRTIVARYLLGVTLVNYMQSTIR